MLEDVEDREQFVAGFVFVGAFVMVWLTGRVVYGEAFAVVLAGILATAATVVYYGYVQYRRHRQEIAEWIDEHRYRFDRVAEALHRVAERIGANRVVGRVDRRLEATVEMLRSRLGEAETAEVPEVVIGALRFLVTGKRSPDPGPGAGSVGSQRGAGGGTADPEDRRDGDRNDDR